MCTFHNVHFINFQHPLVVNGGDLLVTLEVQQALSICLSCICLLMLVSVHTGLELQLGRIPLGLGFNIPLKLIGASRKSGIWCMHMQRCTQADADL